MGEDARDLVGGEDGIDDMLSGVMQTDGIWVVSLELQSSVCRLETLLPVADNEAGAAVRNMEDCPRAWLFPLI
jgi:hypothetical protein